MSVAGASASRKPTAEETAELTAAAETGLHAPHGYFTLTEVRISTLGPWAVATLNHAYRGEELKSLAVYRHYPAKWMLEDSGSGGICIGPDLSSLGMPRAVGFDLGLKPCNRPRPPKLFVLQNVVTQQLVYRPHKIYLSGDGTFSLNRIQWHSYGGRVARATAIAFTKGCTPTCANGHVDRPRAKLRFTTPIECEGRYIYARMHYALRGTIPSGFVHQRWIPLRPTDELGQPAC